MNIGFITFYPHSNFTDGIQIEPHRWHFTTESVSICIIEMAMGTWIWIVSTSGALKWWLKQKSTQQKQISEIRNQRDEQHMTLYQIYDPQNVYRCSIENNVFLFICLKYAMTVVCEQSAPTIENFIQYSFKFDICFSLKCSADSNSSHKFPRTNTLYKRALFAIAFFFPFAMVIDVVCISIHKIPANPFTYSFFFFFIEIHV